MASVQYRRQINYSEENLKQAATILDRFKNTLTNINYRIADDTPTKTSEDLVKAINETEKNSSQQWMTILCSKCFNINL